MHKSVYAICINFLGVLPKPLHYSLMHKIDQHENTDP